MALRASLLALLPLLGACAGNPDDLVGSKGGGRATDASGSGDVDPVNGDPAPPAGAYAAELQRCVDVTNQYRATLGRPPYTRSTALEDFAAKAAASDSASRTPHGYFSRTRGGGVAMAENAIPGWSGAKGVANVVDEGLKMMWNEGPGGGHHDAMASARYKQIGCGIAVTARNEVWVVQNFR